MGKDADKKQVGVRMEFKLYEKLDKYADENFWPISTAVQVILRKFFEEDNHGSSNQNNHKAER